jgi:dsRNA-specific ribonuclease
MFFKTTPGPVVDLLNQHDPFKSLWQQHKPTKRTPSLSLRTYWPHFPEVEALLVALQQANLGKLQFKVLRESYEVILTELNQPRLAKVWPQLAKLQLKLCLQAAQNKQRQGQLKEAYKLFDRALSLEPHCELAREQRHHLLTTRLTKEKDKSPQKAFRVVIHPQTELDIEAIEKRIHYVFNDKNWLKIVFTRIGKCHKLAQQFEKLEFLGDAKLDTYAVNFLYDSQATPQALTETKQRLVSNAKLARIALYLGLHHYLITDSTQQLTTKQLADITEALLGVVYEDSGRNNAITEAFFKRLWEPFGAHFTSDKQELVSLISEPQSQGYAANQLNSYLLRAIQTGASVFTIDSLLTQGAAVNSRDDKLRNSFMLSQDLAVCVLLLNKWKINKQAVDCKGQNALHRAVITDDFEKALVLVQMGIEINQPDFKDNTPLHYAVSLNRTALVELLLANQAKANVTNQAGFTAYQLAEQYALAQLFANQPAVMRSFNSVIKPIDETVIATSSFTL